MKAATDNGGSLIKELQLVYNKARQANITQGTHRDRRVEHHSITRLIRREFKMATGKIGQVIGVVVGVEFPQDAVPACTRLLRYKMSSDENLVEVQQQLGSGVPYHRHRFFRRPASRSGSKRPRASIEVPVGKQRWVVS